ncbi:MAG: hypothetical protein ACTSPL_04450 [Candidatus Odinarchaeia archaeon]
MRKKESLQATLIKLKEHYSDMADIYSARYRELKESFEEFKALAQEKRIELSGDLDAKILAFEECINQLRELIDGVISLEIVDNGLSQQISQLDKHIKSEAAALNKLKVLSKDFIKVNNVENPLSREIKTELESAITALDNSVKETIRLREELFSMLNKKERLIKTAGEYI